MNSSRARRAILTAGLLVIAAPTPAAGQISAAPRFTVSFQDFREIGDASGRVKALTGWALIASTTFVRQRPKLDILDSLAREVSRTYRLAYPIELRSEACSTELASYDPATRRVTLCYELVADIDSIVRALFYWPGRSGAEVDADVISALRFVVLHEIGHALIAMWHLPVTGRTEDAADQFAAVFLSDRQQTLNVASRVFETLAESQDTSMYALGDLHALAAQRAANLKCWERSINVDAKGQNWDTTTADAAMGTILGIPPDRWEACPSEFAQIRESWQRLLRPYARDQQSHQTWKEH